MLYLQQLIKSMSRKNVSKDILLEGIKLDFTPKQTILKDHATKYFPCNMCTPRPSSKPYLSKGFVTQSRKWLVFCNYVSRCHHRHTCGTFKKISFGDFLCY